MKAVVAAFNQEKALVGAFSVITNLRMEFFQALESTRPGHVITWWPSWHRTSEVGGHTHHQWPLVNSKISRLYFSFQKFCSFAQNQWSDYNYDLRWSKSSLLTPSNHFSILSNFLFQAELQLVIHKVHPQWCSKEKYGQKRYLMWNKSETPHWDCCRIIGGLKTTYSSHRLISISYGPPETSRPSAYLCKLTSYD